MQNDYYKGLRSYYLTVAICLVVIAALFLISLFTGRYMIEPEEVIAFIENKEIPELSGRIITKLRIPRTIIALFTGASLAVSGAIYQGVFNNRMASPDLLGVSSGASLGACIGILMDLSFEKIVIASFAAGNLTVCITVMIAKLIGKQTEFSLILSGIATGGLMSSCIGLTKYLADDERKLSEITYWLLGSFSSSTMKEAAFISPVLTICFMICLLSVNTIDIISLGKKEAKVSGVNYNMSVLILISCATLMTASCVSVSGVIGWVGLTVPNLVRLVFGNMHRKVLMLSMLLGIVFMMLTDMLARTLSPDEIPLSVITGIIGTPLFLFSVIGRRKRDKVLQ
ncbi:MAG: iron ABC transporter permease [Lachnospiraceae bacterium]|nr:iron ABC transporter permease [Lachnospiraceae bacterium]